MKNRKIIDMALLALIFSGVAGAFASDLWLHVRVDETDGAKVKVNVPISMVEKAMAMIPEKHLQDGRIHLDECCDDLSLAEMREMWAELQNSPDMTFVTVEEADETVRVWKEGGYLKVHVSDLGSQEEVDVQVPLAVVDALLSGEGDELNIEAAVRRLADEGEGELVTVRGDDEQVRIWVDGIAEAD